MAEPDTESDNSFERMLEALRRGMAAAEADGASNPLMVFLRSFFSFLQGLNDDTGAPDFEDAPSQSDRDRLDRDYHEHREPAERRQYGDFVQSARGWTASTMAQSSARLVAMRQAAEERNGGNHVATISPVEGAVRYTSEFGHREASATGGVGTTEHMGLDIAPATPGEHPNIVAPMPGIVVGVGWRGGYGNMIEIMDIYGTKHRFGHLSSANVQVGQEVQQGQPIGVMGTTGHSTGVHLHYEQRDADNVARAPQFSRDPARVQYAAAPAAPARAVAAPTAHQAAVESGRALAQAAALYHSGTQPQAGGFDLAAVTHTAFNSARDLVHRIFT